MDEQTRSFAKGCVEMHLVGELSSVRLRDELVALLSEDRVEWTMGRLHELGVAHEVHPRLATGPKTAALDKRLDSVVRELGMADEVITWRLRLAAMSRNMEPDELSRWLDQLKVKRSDSAVICTGVATRSAVKTALALTEMSDWEVYRELRSTPVEALVFALAAAESDPVEARLRRYLADLRHRTLSVGGDDLMALGARKGPALGTILERLRELRVMESIEGREMELLAARRMLEETR